MPNPHIRTEEFKRKVSLALKGRKHTEEWNRKIGASQIGRKCSEETRRKISQNHHDVSGSNNPIFGTHRSDATKLKISLANKGKIGWNKGKKIWANKVHPRGAKGKHWKMPQEWVRKLIARNSGEKSHLYIDGRTKKNKNWRGEEWKSLRTACYIRDNYHCRKCKKQVKGFELHAHHIIPYHDGGANTLTNLISLCRSCHMKVENEYRRVGLTRYARDYIEQNKAIAMPAKIDVVNTESEESLIRKSKVYPLPIVVVKCSK